MAAKCIAFYVDVVDNGFLVSVEAGLKPKESLVFYRAKDLALFVEAQLDSTRAALLKGDYECPSAT